MEDEVLREAKSLRDYWKPRNERALADREIINLVKPPARSDKIQWVSNEPKVFYDTATSLISSYPPRFRMPLTVNFLPEEKDKMNKAERFLLGIFRSLDARQMSRGQNYWLRELAWWTLSGWFCVFKLARRNGDGVDFIADMWDPITCYPEWDSDGLVKFARVYEVDKLTAHGMLETWRMKGLDFDYHEKRGRTVEIVNYWNNDRGQVHNSIYVAGQPIKKLTKESFRKIPVEIGAIGSPESTSADYTVRKGENIISANRDMYEYDNKMISLMATILAETAYPNIIGYSQTGAPVVRSENLKGYGDVVNLKIGEKIDLLKHAATPAEVNLLLAYTGKQKQKGSLPDVAYGGLNIEISGFAISQLMAAIKYKMSPYLISMQYAISNIATSLLEQYREGDAKGKFPEVKLSTTNPKEMRKGLFFVEEFTPEDVPESVYIDVTIPITSAIDKTQQIIYARQALQPPQLISRETLWDELLDIQDSEQEYARIIQDELLELPVVKQLALIEQLTIKETHLKGEGRMVEAQAIRRYITSLEMQLMGTGQTAGGGAGIPSNVMPPEMVNNPDNARAAAGVPPPGISRSPQTPEQRSESKSRTGRLLNARGEPV